MRPMQRVVHVVGDGMIPFTKPGASEPYPLMGARRPARAAGRGVDDAEVQQAYVGYVYGDFISGQAAIYGVGLTSIPVFNVNNNCATGSSALYLARQAVESDMVECAIALGFEQMQPGALKGAWDDRPSPMARFADAMGAHQGLDAAAPRAAQCLGGAGLDYMKQYGIRANTFDSGDMRRVVGYDMSAAAVRQVYETAGVGPQDVQVVELHDCFTANERITYEALGLAAEGGAEKFILEGHNTHGGRVVTNPSGGLLSKGHPLGATGLAQCAERTWQLRGQAGERQVERARLALAAQPGAGRRLRRHAVPVGLIWGNTA